MSSELPTPQSIEEFAKALIYDRTNKKGSVVYVTRIEWETYSVICEIQHGEQIQGQYMKYLRIAVPFWGQHVNDALQALKNFARDYDHFKNPRDYHEKYDYIWWLKNAKGDWYSYPTSLVLSQRYYPNG